MNSHSATAEIEAPTHVVPLPPAESVAAAPRSFAFDNVFLVVAISALLITPCFWHQHIEAGDLGSHVYNAWLVQLIERGQAPGLWIAPQRNNVLFDLLLSGLASVVSLNTAAQISAAIAVLIFFWGAFASIAANVKRPPWALAPVLAMVSYGWTFNHGFFNYYISVGLAFGALAIFSWRPGWTRFLALALVPLVYLAHPLGIALLFGAGAYIAVAKLIPVRLQSWLVLAAIGALTVARLYLVRHFRVDPALHSAIFFNGLDQLLFTNRYAVVLLALGIIFAVAFVREALRPGGLWKWLALCAIPLQLYILIEAVIQIFPGAIYLPQYAAPISELSERLTSISAVLLCAVLATMALRKWQIYGLSAAALVFFAFLYQDTGRIDRMESQVESLISSIPPGQRVLLAIHQPLNYRFSSKHILDFACVGRCFAYGNYEAPARQFRVRALPENPIVVSDIRDAAAMEDGNYVPGPNVLPIFQIYQCGSTWTDLCIRPLGANP